jgi:hypothetical protein
MLAHTNLAEIKRAFDLFWRNDVASEKLKIGFGFYSRSFRLAEPSSSFPPGCRFKGGAEPGACTKKSGTMSYRQKNYNPVDVDGTGDFQGISKPTFDYSYSVTGSLSAHLMPTFEFGIHFDEIWGVPSAAVKLIADGSVEVVAKFSGGQDEICPFTYEVNVGARLYTHVVGMRVGSYPRTDHHSSDFDFGYHAKGSIVF